MQRAKPPFRADHVGSLLRSAALKNARAKRASNAISADELKTVEDREIEALIRKQEAVGLKSITDGENRRRSWQTDFLEGLPGVESYTGERKFKFQGVQSPQVLIRVNGKLGAFDGHPMIEHFKFLKARTKQTPKMTIPSPSAVHFRHGREGVPEAIYPDMDEFYRDLGTTYRKAVRGFADAGCRYLQLDEVNFTYLCDPKQRQIVIDRGDDPDALPLVYASMINAAVSDIPDDMTVTMHLCRGNFRSTFIASGGYEPVAELLFNSINVHGYFMEFDTERAGGFEPLRFVPKGKMVVLGLVTSKSGTLETKDELKRRIDQAAKFVPLDQLCLSPQCGFASSEEGNILAEEEQWAKLELVVGTAEEVWGDEMKRTVPPFRADHVGSLLRPKALHEARAKFANGEMEASELKEVEDREIERVIEKQEEVGLQAVTDGEFRRSWWHLDFLWGLDGTEKHVMDTGIAFAAVTTRNEGVKVTGKLGMARPHPMVEHFKFVQAHTKETPKITIPAPSAIYGRPSRTPISNKAYPSMDAFWDDLGDAYKNAVRGFVDAGCRYLQLDEVFIAMLCDPKYCQQMRDRGDDPDKLGPLYGKLINAAMSDIPSDMRITMHLCRGNYKSGSGRGRL